MTATPKTPSSDESPSVRATYQDIENVPPERVAELVEGRLITSPRPSMPHAMVSSALATLISMPFRFGVDGPGGWHIVFEPELHFGSRENLDVLVPDLAGWRVERLPEVPEVAHMKLAPDWICEVLSDSTEAVDRIRKMPIYLREGVAHAWLVSPRHRTVEVYRRSDAGWVGVGQYQGAAVVRAEPFDAIDLELGRLWSAP